MLAIEEALWEMHAVDTANEQGLPPGYRFHPTDEELVAFYLASKVFNGNFCGVQIAEIDLNRCEPWELPDIGKIGKREWYFFSSRDRKYPTGLRTNRATEAGYWKATGKDKEVYSSTSNCSSNASQQQLIGMKKTLVFYKGRAPRGVKTRWVMHEYRLVGHLASLRTSKEEWVICRIHHKAGAEKIRTNPLLMSQLQTYPSLSINNMITLPPNFLNCSTSTSLVDPPIPNAQNSVNHHLLLHIHQESTDDITNTNTSINNGTVPISQPRQHSLFSKIDNFQQCSTNYPSSHQSFLFKSLLSHHQDHPLESSAVAPNGSCFQQVEANNLNWMDKIQENSLFFELSGLGGWGTGSAGLPSVVAAAETDHHNELSISSSVAFNRTGFQMMLDSHISGHGKSVCLDS